jgi:hypothetical protein
MGSQPPKLTPRNYAVNYVLKVVRKAGLECVWHQISKLLIPQFFPSISAGNTKS